VRWKREWERIVRGNIVGFAGIMDVGVRGIGLCCVGSERERVERGNR
jgi:hypothetical protein